VQSPLAQNMCKALKEFEVAVLAPACVIAHIKAAETTASN
jgi:hypothetical protein